MLTLIQLSFPIFYLIKYQI